MDLLRPLKRQSSRNRCDLRAEAEAALDIQVRGEVDVEVYAWHSGGGESVGGVRGGESRRGVGLSHGGAVALDRESECGGEAGPADSEGSLWEFEEEERLRDGDDLCSDNVGEAAAIGADRGPFAARRWQR